MNLGMLDFSNIEFDKFDKVWKTRCEKYGSTKPTFVKKPHAKRIIVVGDIHGDYENCIKALQAAKVIDNDHKWCGGDTILVQVGDQIDNIRFPLSNISSNTKSPNFTEGEFKKIEESADDYKVLFFFTELHKQASMYGGAVYSLVGNHELLNVSGNYKYVSKQNLADPTLYEYYNKYQENIPYTKKLVKPNIATRETAFLKGNPMAEFLGCTRYMFLIIGDILFVHAGILDNILSELKSVEGLDKVNKLLSLYLFNEFNNDNSISNTFFNGIDSPLWTRHYNSTPDEQLCPLITKVTDTFNVGKIIIGHIPMIDNGITFKCDNKLGYTDVGMSTVFSMWKQKNTDGKENSRLGSKNQVLEIIDGTKLNIIHVPY